MAGNGSSSSTWGPKRKPSAIVGGGQPRKKPKKDQDNSGWVEPDVSWSSFVPPPPPPPARHDVVGFGDSFPAKARPKGPEPPTWAPPLSVIRQHRQMDGVKSEPAVSVTSEPDVADWTVFTQPDAPPLNAPTRPVFVQCVKDWLDANLSTAEFATLIG